MSYNEKLKRMIDDNKITEAFKMYNEKVENELAKRLTRKPTSAERYADTTLRQCAFIAGVKWMQEEFLKGLTALEKIPLSCVLVTNPKPKQRLAHG